MIQKTRFLLMQNGEDVCSKYPEKYRSPSPHLNAEGFFIFMNVGCDHQRFATIRTGQSSLAGRTCITAWTPGRTITAPSARDTRQSSLACLPVRRFLLLSQVR